MNYRRLKIAGLCAGLATGSATVHAQTGLTLYGILDAGIAYVNNSTGHSVVLANAGGMQVNRWGLRGTEDLGGGYSSVFVLENGFNIQSGKLNNDGRMFGRQAFVGIGTPYGTVTLGRQYDSATNFVGPFEAGSQWAGYGAHVGDLDSLNASNRMNNAIKYASNTYRGLSFGGMFSLGGVAGDFAHNRGYSLGARYVNGPVSVGAAYVNIRDPNAAYYDGTATTAGNTNAVYTGFLSASTLSIATAGLAYQVGNLTLGGTYSNTRYEELGSDAGPNPNHYSGSVGFNTYESSAKYQLTPALLLGVAANYTQGSSFAGHEGSKYLQYNLGADYFLSKRTDIYGAAIYQRALGIDSTGKPAVAQIEYLSTSSGPKQIALEIGLRHKF